VERAIGVQTRTRFACMNCPDLWKEFEIFGRCEYNARFDSDIESISETYQTAFVSFRSLIIYRLRYSSDHGQIDLDDNWYIYIYRIREISLSNTRLTLAYNVTLNYQSVNMHVHDIWRRIFREWNVRHLHCKWHNQPMSFQGKFPFVNAYHEKYA